MFDSIAKENTKLHNCNWQKISNYHPRLSVIIDSKSRKKTFFSLNLVSHQSVIDEINLYGKDPFKSKYQLLINKREHISSKQIDCI